MLVALPIDINALQPLILKCISIKCATNSFMYDQYTDNCLCTIIHLAML